MENGDGRPFQQENDINVNSWNVLELESHMQLRNKISELINLTNNSMLSTSDLRGQLGICKKKFGKSFPRQLVRALQNEDEIVREAVVWLLTQLDEPDTIPLLKKLTQQEEQPQAIRLSAALALAGMGVTAEYYTARATRKSQIRAI